MTCPEVVTAKAVCRCTPRASPPESIGPSSAMLCRPVKFRVVVSWTTSRTS
jgi:hypothetical protein